MQSEQRKTTSLSPHLSQHPSFPSLPHCAVVGSWTQKKTVLGSKVRVRGVSCKKKKISLHCRQKSYSIRGDTLLRESDLRIQAYILMYTIKTVIWPTAHLPLGVA